VIGQVFVKTGKAQTMDVGLYLICSGLAWYYKEYAKEPLYQETETEARSKGVGLWEQEKPIPPWEWRKTYKQAITP